MDGSVSQEGHYYSTRPRRRMTELRLVALLLLLLLLCFTTQVVEARGEERERKK